MTNTEIKKYTIDATGKSLGRLAAEISSLLNGKNKVDFVRNIAPNVKVTVENASKLVVTGNKMNDVVHKNFSGYPGGLRETPLRRVVEKKGYSELVIHAVSGMLPKNRLQAIKLKNLSITE